VQPNKNQKLKIMLNINSAKEKKKNKMKRIRCCKQNERQTMQTWDHRAKASDSKSSISKAPTYFSCKSSIGVTTKFKHLFYRFLTVHHFGAKQNFYILLQ